MTTATVIIPTTGADELSDAISSVIYRQNMETNCYVVIDGEQYYRKAKKIIYEFGNHPNLKFSVLPINVGSGGFYGHRIYAAFSHLINTDYVLFLDQDNWFGDNHVKSCIDTIEANGLDWSYSLRKIFSKNGDYICEDNCESLGLWDGVTGNKHIDTNCYCLKTEVASRVASAWHGGWGQDRVYRDVLSTHFPKYMCNGEYTVGYRLAGNEGSVTREFFQSGNFIMKDRCNGVFPWKRKV